MAHFEKAKTSLFSKGERSMRIIKFTALLLLLCIIFTSFTGCAYVSNAIYGVRMYDQAGSWIREDFAAEHEVWYKSNPRDYTFIVDSKEEYDEIFITGIDELDVNFDKKMIIVHTFTDTTVMNYWIRNARVKKGTLKISYQENAAAGFGRGTTSSPYQRWFAIKVNKMDIESIEFENVTAKYLRMFIGWINN